MSDMDDAAGTLAARYSELVLLVRNLLALDDHGNFADGVGPDDRMFARAWVRAKVRQAVRPGVLHNESSDNGTESSDNGTPSPTGGQRSAPSTANPV